jgi:hypothetical protein
MDTLNGTGLRVGATALLVTAMAPLHTAYAQPGAEPSSDAQSEPAAAQAAPEPPPAPRRAFGDRGQWAILGSSSSASLYSETFSASAAHFVDASIGIGVDSFVARNFSLGIDAEAGYGDNKGYGAANLVETTSTHFAGGVRFGVNVPLGRILSWYPRLTLGMNANHSSTQTLSVTGPNAPVGPPSDTSLVGPWINIYAPLLIHPVPHVFVGLGPRFEHTFGSLHGGPYDGSQTSLFSVDTVVGVWWGGAGEAEAPPEEQPPKHAFGERGQEVLTAASFGSVASSTYSRSNASSLSVDLEPGFDYFVMDQVSLGVDSFASYSTSKSFDSSGVETNSSSTSLGLAVRPGVDLPLLRGALSVWLQGELGFGFVTSKQDSAAGSNDHSRNRTWVRLQAPLLIHATTHMFLGAGPYLFAELSDTDQLHYENDATKVGATFVLGGWL